MSANEGSETYKPKNFELSIEYDDHNDDWIFTVGERYNNYNSPFRFKVDMNRPGSDALLRRWFDLVVDEIVQRVRSEQSTVNLNIIKGDHNDELA